MRLLMVASQWPVGQESKQASYVAQMVAALRRLDVAVDVFPFRGRGNPLNYLSAWRQVHLQLRNNTYDVVHADFGNSTLLALPGRVSLVVTLHGSDVIGVVGAGGRYMLKGWILRHISRLAALRADEVILVSRHLRKYLPERPYNIIPGGVDLAHFTPVDKAIARAKLGLLPDVPLVFFPADPRIPVKRFGLARAAVDVLKQEWPKVNLLTGGGIGYELMPLYMSAADVLLLTSRHEGSPTVVKEAMACNLPVVAVDVGDVRERVDGIAGNVVCADDDPQTIADALWQVLAAGSRTEGRGAVQSLTWESVARRVLAVYKAVVT